MNKSVKGLDVIDLCIDAKDVKGGLCLDDYFFIRDLNQRKITINEDIEPYIVSDVVREILNFNKEDKGIPVKERKPIILTLISNGGDVNAGFELIDVILASKTPVYTVNLGWQYSMGFLIGLAGHKRFCSKNATFLMHDGSSAVWNSSAKALDQMEFNRKLENRIKEYIIERSNLTEKEYDEKLRVEWYLFAEEAKEKGFTDCIIGVDCGLDDVI